MNNKPTKILIADNTDDTMCENIISQMQNIEGRIVLIDKKDISEPIQYNPSPEIQIFADEKKFVCKGKHQYREIVERDGSVISSNWVCECGRSL